jgi:hypothetical protein
MGAGYSNPAAREVRLQRLDGAQHSWFCDSPEHVTAQLMVLLTRFPYAQVVLSRKVGLEFDRVIWLVTELSTPTLRWDTP